MLEETLPDLDRPGGIHTSRGTQAEDRSIATEPAQEEHREEAIHPIKATRREMTGLLKEDARRREDTQEALLKQMSRHFQSQPQDLEHKFQQASNRPALQYQAKEVPAAVDPILRAVRQRIASNGWKQENAEIEKPKIINANTIIRSYDPSS